MRPPTRVLVLAATAVLSACGGPKGYDEMNLRVEEVGDVPVGSLSKVPATTGEIVSWRTGVTGQLFAAVRTQAICPRALHTAAGAHIRKDRIELCFSATPVEEPTSGASCEPDVYVKYELANVPADLQPVFVFVGPCGSVRP